MEDYEVMAVSLESGAFAEYVYRVGLKTVPTRMRVVWEQLIPDMVEDENMDQLKKMVAVKYLDKVRRRLLRAADRESLDYDTVREFKDKMGYMRLNLVFKRVKGSLRRDQYVVARVSLKDIIAKKFEMEEENKY